MDIGNSADTPAASLKKRTPIFEYAANSLRDMANILIERGAQYSDIADNSKVFTQIMEAMGVVRPAGMTEVEFHCLANIATKMSRIAVGNRGHQDNWLDLANYATLQLSDIRRNQDNQT